MLALSNICLFVSDSIEFACLQPSRAHQLVEQYSNASDQLIQRLHDCTTGSALMDSANQDEARKCGSIARDALLNGDAAKAEKFASKALKLSGGSSQEVRSVVVQMKRICRAAITDLGHA